MCSVVGHKLLTTQACISTFKTMVLSVIKYGDVIYSGTSIGNLGKMDELFYRGLRICMGNDIIYTKDDLYSECKITKLSRRRDLHFLLYMHKQSKIAELLKPCRINTRLHTAPVFLQYIPSSEKAQMNDIYRGTLLWNGLPAIRRNMEFKDFKKWLKNELLV